MAKDTRFKIAPFMSRVVWSTEWVSNGHFAAKKEAVRLGAHLTSDDAVTCAYPKADLITEWTDEKLVEILAAYTGVRAEFVRSPWVHRTAALFLDSKGHAAWFDAEYCDALRLEVLYGPIDSAEVTAFFNAPNLEDSTVVIMPMKVPVDWQQVAQTVATATALEEEPTATPFAGMEPPAEDETPVSVAESLMDSLFDPKSEASQILAETAAKVGGSVTVSVNGRSATIDAASVTSSIAPVEAQGAPIA